MKNSMETMGVEIINYLFFNFLIFIGIMYL